MFAFPTPTLFGPGTIGEIPTRLTRLGITRPLVVTDAGLVNTDAFRALAKTLDETRLNASWFLYSGVHPNPSESDVREPAALFREQQCEIGRAHV